MNYSKIQKFIGEDHKFIDGWFFGLDQVAFYELFSIQNQQGLRGDVCEVGVYKGKSFVFLSLLKGQNDRLIGFDLFPDDLEEVTKRNLSDYGVAENTELHKGLTSDLELAELNSILSSRLRFLHIDAGHEYHEVLQQLQLFSPYMDDLGIISMDDYQDREFPGIEAAVLDFADRDRPRRFVPFLAGSNKMYLCASQHASHLQTLLMSRQNFMDASRLTRVRDFNILIMRSKLPVSVDRIKAQIEASDFPKWPDDTSDLSEKSRTFSQWQFGSGELD